MITHDQDSIVRLTNAHGVIVGGGFRIDDHRVVTCAHVVNSALGRRQDAQEKPAETVTMSVALPPDLSADGAARTATVSEWRPPGTKAPSDLALLELDRSVDGAEAAEVYAPSDANDLWKH